MAIYLKGMTPAETADLTGAMLRSGKIADLSGLPGRKVDKHSTGGVGDKVSLHLAPMAAACGVIVPMISGRGLGHTGGTLDKLEAIPGMKVALPMAAIRAQLRKVGAAIVGQTGDIAPADRKLYALRDVTATVECIPLICASILSKKLASGIDVLVLDVKYGRGAFMKDKARARRLAETITAVSRAMGTPARALLTAMDQPLGRSVGNALEVAESIACLRGSGPDDLMEVTYAIGVQMLLLARAAKTGQEARKRLEESISSGAAFEKFRELVRAQGGDLRAIDDPSRLPRARIRVPLPSPRDGYVQDVDAMGVALASLRLGAGRAKAEDPVDHAVGVDAIVKAGERVRKGAALCIIHASGAAAAAEASRILAGAYRVGARPPAKARLIDAVIG
jgi:pyrimidine-nucleoside phosphorylase